MDLNFLINTTNIKDNVIIYLLQHIYNATIRKDILNFLEQNSFELSQKTTDLVLKQLIDFSTDAEFNQILGLFAINNVQSVDLIEYALDKHIHRTSIYIKNHINKKSILIDMALRQITNKLINNIGAQNEIEVQNIDFEKYENLRDIWEELMESNKHNYDLINSVYKQILNGFIEAQDECKRQCYLVDLITKTRYGTHYNMDKYPELDTHFLEGLKNIALRLGLHNKNIITYLFLNTSAHWIELYTSATDAPQHIGLDHTLDDLTCLT